MEQKFYICEHCKNIITKINDAGVPVMCCGEAMKELVAGTVEASHEKHIPVVTVDGNKVTVVIGEVLHPMAEEHFIEWVVLETNKGCSLKRLKAGDVPSVIFAINSDEKVENVYAYCNLHGLWKN